MRPIASLVAISGISLRAAVAQFPRETIAACPIPTAPVFNEPKLPDPFTFVNGSKVASEAGWACRREEIRSLFQQYEFGPKPPKPEVTSSWSGNSLTITSSEGGKSMSFSVTVRKPSGAGPFPAVIAFGFASIPIPANVATITYNNDELASTTDATHGVGKFYSLYGKDHPAGGLAVWAWGVSRILDGLEEQGADVTGIDPARIGVTGCSRNGKGAMVSGAFDDRIALTIPQEGGSGGAGCWRIAQIQKDGGTNIETAAQIVTGDAWFTPGFTKWSPGNMLPQLPYDHHELYGLIMPRGLIVIENGGIAYLGDMSTFGCASAGRKIARALGDEAFAAFGYSQASHADHCGVPASQAQDITTYINRYLLGGGKGEPIFKSDKTYAFDLEEWAGWDVPTLVE